jgi:hypothetical protein
VLIDIVLLKVKVKTIRGCRNELIVTDTYGKWNKKAGKP